MLLCETLQCNNSEIVVFDYLKIISPHSPRNLSKITKNIIKTNILLRFVLVTSRRKSQKQNNKLNKLRSILIKLVGCSDRTGYDELCTNV